MRRMSNNYIKFSDITTSDVKNYLRIDEISADDLALLGTILEGSKSHVLKYTGRTAEEADLIPELTIAVYAVCQELYDKRTYAVKYEVVSKVIESILGAVSVNLL